MIEEKCIHLKPIELQITGLVSLGKGVAYKIESRKLVSLHKELQHTWLPHLTPQDQQGLRPHITIQNKVSLAEAKQLHQQLNEVFTPFTALNVGLILWKYLNGPWQLYRQFRFDG
jgi:2'-5' RNA ligase